MTNSYSHIGFGNPALLPVWTTSDNKAYFIDEMTTTHIKNCLERFSSQQPSHEIAVWTMIFKLALKKRKAI